MVLFIASLKAIALNSSNTYKIMTKKSEANYGSNGTNSVPIQSDAKYNEIEAKGGGEETSAPVDKNGVVFWTMFLVGKDILYIHLCSLREIE